MKIEADPPRPRPRLARAPKQRAGAAVHRVPRRARAAPARPSPSSPSCPCSPCNPCHPSSAETQSGEPARPSTDFLAEPESRAARFTELGMFGLSRTVAAPAGGSGGKPSAGPTSASGASGQGKRPGHPQRDVRRRQQICSIPALAPGKPVTCELPGPVRAKVDSGKPCALPGDAPGPVVPERDDHADTEAPVRPTRPRPRPQPQRPGISLTLHEADGAVEIIAGAPPIDPQTRAQLRRLIEAILARNGLSLAQFQLNGAPLASDLSGRRGGTYGTRTR